MCLSLLPTKDRKSADMLWNAAESQPYLCRTTAFPESKRMLQLNHRNYKRSHLFLFELWILLNARIEILSRRYLTPHFT
ncbi:hypothetical protein MtrunA17_Chr5g0430631 [Medicago truncatula]|uniref:Uncharacterized protein n=1 Tax=Medicago truncatula TaxID=3880 RepID=A0A396I115_MEDTR|nr:hypothetical protein MtrunA17_Chr5g0430631 [Medicago truncatula]